MIRRATKSDMAALIGLLYQADMVHHHLRPDLFKGDTSKYSEAELATILDDESKPIFVYDFDGQVLGHAFCQISEVRDHRLLHDIKTLYIDDICVEEAFRCSRIGTALFDFVRRYAESLGCYNITLNVWEGNDSAERFYRQCGLRVQKTGMELIL